MLAAPPARRFLTVLPLAVFIYGCSDPATAPTPRIDAKSHTLVAPVVTVTNTDDAGPGSLRQAIIDAPDGATIQFGASIAGQTIVLSTGALSILDKPLTIEGPLPAGMTISGGLVDRVILMRDAVVVLRNLSIVNGKTESFGGGISVIRGKLTLDHSLVANNELTAQADFKPFGGGIYAGGELVVVNSTVSGNIAGFGGGIYSEENADPVTLHNSTIAGNIARNEGGGLLAYKSVSLRNTIIANNIEADDGLGAPKPNCSFRATTAVAYSGTNMSNDDTCGSGLGMVVASPLPLGTLAANGGPTKTHALAAGSPAIDGGSMCTEATDQRYVPRNQGPSCDVGAFEFTYGTITVTLNPNAAVNNKTGVATVTGTIKCSTSASTVLDVQMSQTQKVNGKFTTIIQAQGSASVPACGTSPSSWSVALTPATGKFEPGAATGTASTATVPGAFLPANVTAALKLFQVK